MGRFNRCPYLSSVTVTFVAVTMPSLSVTPISVTVTLSTRRPVTIPAKRTEPRDAHIKGQNRKNVGDFTTFHNLTYRDVLGIFTVLCSSICASLETKIKFGDFIAFYDLNYRDVLRICTDLCPRVGARLKTRLNS